MRVASTRKGAVGGATLLLVVLAGGSAHAQQAAFLSQKEVADALRDATLYMRLPNMAYEMPSFYSGSAVYQMTGTNRPGRAGYRIEDGRLCSDENGRCFRVSARAGGGLNFHGPDGAVLFYAARRVPGDPERLERRYATSRPEILPSLRPGERFLDRAEIERIFRGHTLYSPGPDGRGQPAYFGDDGYALIALPNGRVLRSMYHVSPRDLLCTEHASVCMRVTAEKENGLRLYEGRTLSVFMTHSAAGDVEGLRQLHARAPGAPLSQAEADAAARQPAGSAAGRFVGAWFKAMMDPENGPLDSSSPDYCDRARARGKQAAGCLN